MKHLLEHERFLLQPFMPLVPAPPRGAPAGPAPPTPMRAMEPLPPRADEGDGARVTFEGVSEEEVEEEDEVGPMPKALLRAQSMLRPHASGPLEG